MYIKNNTKALKALQDLEKTTNKQIIENFKLINQLEEVGSITPDK